MTIVLVQVIYGEEFVNKFIFDVDGTLTPSRGKIDLEFKMFFNTFCLTNEVYLVTGSDKPKTVEQISEETYNLAKRVYNCSGCDVWEANKSVRSSDWNMPREQLSWLEDKLEEILYDDDLKNDHYEVLSKVSELGGIGRWLYTKDKKYQIQINLKCLLFQ